MSVHDQQTHDQQTHEQRASITIRYAPSVESACQRFLANIGEWVHACMAEYRSLPPSDVHDQATYTVSWLPYIRATGDKEAVRFMRGLRDDISRHFHRSGAWSHGYWKSHEVHHGTEHFELFLASLYELDPNDGSTVAHFLDAAEHIGNWQSGHEEWFDWERKLFRSLWLGTETARREAGMAVNMADHLRLVNLSLCANRMMGETRYLELAESATMPWARAVAQSDTLPIGLLESGTVYALDSAADGHYRQFMGQASALIEPVDRAENFLASSGINAFLDLWQRTDNALFRQAAERLLDVLVTQLDDPDAGAAADALRRYRRMTGSTRYDGQLVAAAERAFDRARPPTLLSINPYPQRAERPSGVGKRQDMPEWFENGAPRRAHPALLAAAADVMEDADLAAAAVDLARHYFLLARRVYPHGRHHGCAATTVSAVGRGHGRENNAGVITAVLEPVLHTFNGRK